MTSIAHNLQAVRQKLSHAAEKSQRNPSNITLLAVSKTQTAHAIEEAYSQGQRHFGENYLQESLEKIDQLSGLDIVWHFIGPLQSNKTRPIAEKFSWVHSVDRLKIAQRLSAQRPKDSAPLNICIQVNISDESNKSGCSTAELPLLAAQIATLPNIRLRGLMAIPQATDNLEAQTQAFSKMKRLLNTLQSELADMDTLSMGMSGDMDSAIAQGSTIVRIGTAIFGQRN